MSLILSALSLNDQPLSQPVVARFDAQGGTIGRGDQNTLALPDPERHISRQHARISAEGKGWRITNLSSANAVTVAGRTLGQGESAPVRHRDLVRIGSFLLEVRDDSAVDEAATRTITRPRPAPPVAHLEATRLPAALPASPAAANAAPPTPAAPAPADDPFADFFGPALGAPAVATPPPTPPSTAASDLPWAPVPPRALASPFDASSFGQPSPPPSATAAADPFADLIGSDAGASGGSIDALFGGPAAGGTAAALDDFLRQPIGPEAPGAAPPRAATPAPAPASPSATSSLPDHVPAIQAAFEPPRPPPPAPMRPVFAPSLPRASDSAAAPAPDGDERARLWQAFCDGAGLKLALPDGLTPELMQVIGRILHDAVAGTVQMMAIRAATKQELRAEVTMIQARHNNPLKFSPDAHAALEQLLQPPMRGFMAGPEAMNDAMQDLVGHTIGTMAGMRAALEGVLDRFAPTALEGKLSGQSMLDAVLPMNRRARLWELYLQHFEAIRRDAQDDFHTLFGRAFLAAYEQQLDRLQPREGRSARPGESAAGRPAAPPDA